MSYAVVVTVLSCRIVTVFALAFFTVACEKDDAEPPQKPGPDPHATEVFDRCRVFAARLCASATACCESSTPSFSAERCTQSFASSFCNPASQAVGGERATYHPEAEEPCLMAWARAHATCNADWQEIVAIRKEVWEACKMVRGTSAAGSGCSTSATCEQPDGPRTARCLTDPVTRSTTTCQVLELLAEGAECPFPLGEVSVCDVGLYCTTTERDRMGTCERAVPEGEACDPDVPLNPECGLGSYCGLEDGLCHRATNFGGSSCAQHTECVSFNCPMSASGGTCAEAPLTAADLCQRGAE